MTHNHIGNEISFDILLALPFVLAIIMYVLLARFSNHRRKRWPFYRYLSWMIGILCAAAAVIGPVANHAHDNFTAHMIGHLLLGMLAPLLLALSAPITLLLRILKVTPARKLSRLLKSWPVSLFVNPVVTSILNIGGLWVLYTSELYTTMQQHFLLHIIVHMHVFLAGYLYTISIIYIDPTPHRYSYIFRALVVILSLAAHGVLSKYIYANPPAGVSIDQAEMGGMLMYYGGDLVELAMIFLFCYQWYRATRPRNPVSIDQ
jgi:putative membrane protein